jgi:hypothetical protein
MKKEILQKNKLIELIKEITAYLINVYGIPYIIKTGILKSIKLYYECLLLKKVS